MISFRTTLAAAALALLAACNQGFDPSEVDTSVIGAGDNWDNPGGDWAESHFSRLGDINPDNVGSLGLAWEYDLGTYRVQEATPLVIDGVLYTAGNLGRVYALDATTGEELWTFDPGVDMQYNRYACCDQANRGVAFADGKVFVASLDGWLYALDAGTGGQVWKVDTIVDRDRAYTITGAPEIAGDLVVIGNAGAEYDVRGYVTAYDLQSSQMKWRFYTIPHDPDEGPQESEALEAALDSWDPESRWDIGGGGTVWDAITYDPVHDQVIIGSGNGGPYPLVTRSPAGGDNLYLNSLIAIDRESGEMNWYFQETPQDSWDLTATQPMVLTEMEVDGEARDVILHTPKNGFFFVVDRENGRPLRAHQLVRTSWASGWDLETGRPQLTPEFSDYRDGPKLVFPASVGARNWHPAAFDPTRNLYFSAVVDMGNLMFIPPGQEDPAYRPTAMAGGAALIFTSDLEAALPTLPPPMQEAVLALPQWDWVRERAFSSELRAIDPDTGAVKWSAPFDGWQDRGGVLATESGLVVHGTLSGKVIVRNAETGAILKEIETGSSILAAPMTYRVDGVQYIAIQTGWGGGGWGFVPPYAAAYAKDNRNRLMVFKLDGGEVTLAPDLPPLTVAPEPPEQLQGVTPEIIALGSALFTETCSICHSNQPRAPLPDLRRMNAGTHQAFEQVVLEGLLLPNGMPRFDDLLSEEQVRAIHAFLISEQQALRERELQLEAAGEPLDSRALTILSSF